MTYEEFLLALRKNVIDYVDRKIYKKKKKYIPNWSKKLYGCISEEFEGVDVIIDKSETLDNYFLYIYLQNLPAKVNMQKYLMEEFGIDKKGLISRIEMERSNLSFKSKVIYSNSIYYLRLKDEDLDIIYKKLQKNQ